MDKETLDCIRRRMAHSAVGPSTIRGMAPAGTIGLVREFLGGYNLGQLKRWTQRTYTARLDEMTAALLVHLRASGKEQALGWGGCRKCVNIFLRNAMYNRYLAEKYQLDRLEPWMEVPLDSHVAAGLRKEEGISDTPRWETVIGLTREASEGWQGIASVAAAGKGIHRVHLDVHYWRQKKVEDGKK
ncbi:hypothetical protein PP715_19090 [Ralstonia solanacearum]|uniref:hypothetical protein n=1 Tax=Ralstonia solanacearum TaxID=305 RepID=UPI0011AEA460|nr:hypothetical protein [Ralstonia solanacearum]MCL9841445.1 hypothetical protein [Ralstonia solanacearum]MDB0533811.1 hypothetical protein [Ralstonia solanacearum]MDB0538518.1 hypothetical protein [Ralstonia solanacearum]MDB0548426.1 hypothetical protein [Ralstonia solanacearum]MDB0563413.1 hypothetical protein [Ralstonia solanacearum]